MTHTDHSLPALKSGIEADLEAVEAALPPIGRRRFIAGVGTIAGAAAIASALPTGTVKAVAPGAAKFVALPSPIRAADTRDSSYNFSWVDSNKIRIPLLGLYGIPQEATAVVGTATTVSWRSGNFITLCPAGGEVPNASNLNTSFYGEMNANLTVVKIANGGIDMYRKFDSADMLFDVLGYFVPVSTPVADGRFIPLGTPARAFDSRLTPMNRRLNTRETITVDVTPWVPADASAVVVNLTVDEAAGFSFFTVFPYTDTEVPRTSSLNTSVVNEMRAAAVVCAVSNVGGQRRIKVYAEYPGNVIVDVFGYFTGPSSAVDSEGLFVPSAPTRIMDTRDYGPNGRLWSRWVKEIDVPADAAANGSAIVANVTMTLAHRPNFLTVLRAREAVPTTSNVNAMRAFMDVPNLAMSRITALPGANKAAIQIFTVVPTHLVVDYAGYFTGQPAIASTASPINPPPGPAPLEWTVNFNKGISERGNTTMPPARDGDAIRVTDSGYLWHWEGTGMVGEAAHVAVFAHRTEGPNAPFRNIDQLGPGDTWTVDTADGRRYTYAFAQRFLTDGNTQNILNATRAVGGNTFSMVACTIGTGANPWAATSTKYRIIVTGVEVGWTSIRL